MSEKSNKRMVLRLVGLVVFMGVMSFVAVPFYSWFCAVTGYGGTTSEASGADVEVVDRTVTIRFDASLERDMPWEFKPAQHEMVLKLGEVGLAFFEAYNPTDRVIAGSAGYNVTPFSAGNYFTKIDCFCFTQQVLQPGERVMMPVTFYVDPDIVNDREAHDVTSITLSYTFYETELPDQTDLAQSETANNTRTN